MIKKFKGALQPGGNGGKKEAEEKGLGEMGNRRGRRREGGRKRKRAKMNDLMVNFHSL